MAWAGRKQRVDAVSVTRHFVGKNLPFQLMKGEEPLHWKLTRLGYLELY